VVGIVKSHGGFMSVYSEVGRGTTFKVFLPATTEAEMLQETSGAVVPLAQSELLLLVDDERPILQIGKALLEGHGYQILTAEDAAEALAVFAKRMDEIGLVLTDLSMPVMDGIALIRTLRKMKPDVRIVASTGRGGQEQHSHELEELNIHACLTKPYNKDTLLRTLHDALHAKP
jgi:CheY-like chemotaxis protein